MRTHPDWYNRAMWEGYYAVHAVCEHDSSLDKGIAERSNRLDGCRDKAIWRAKFIWIYNDANPNGYTGYLCDLHFQQAMREHEIPPEIVALRELIKALDIGLDPLLS